MTTDNILAGMHENKSPGSDGNYLVCPHAPDGTRSAVWELLRANAKGSFFEGRYPSSVLANPKENVNGIPAVSVSKADIEKAIGVLKPTLNVRTHVCFPSLTFSYFFLLSFFLFYFYFVRDIFFPKI